MINVHIRLCTYIHNLQLNMIIYLTLLYLINEFIYDDDEELQSILVNYLGQRNFVIMVLYCKMFCCCCCYCYYQKY